MENILTEDEIEKIRGMVNKKAVNLTTKEYDTEMLQLAAKAAVAKTLATIPRIKKESYDKGFSEGYEKGKNTPISRGDKDNDADVFPYDDAVILEELAELEHKQWVSWRTEIEKKNPDLKKSVWLNAKYSELPEKIKEDDRRFARLILPFISEAKLKSYKK